MKANIKRFLIIFLVLITFSCALLFCACSCNPDDEKQPIPHTEGFSFVTATNQLLVGEEYVPPIEFVYVAGVEIVFSSSDSAVATIDETGKITAIKPGKTTILGEYGDSNDKFELEVITDGYLPTLEFEAGLQTANYVEKGATLDVKPIVYFNGKAFTDFTVEYTLSNPNYGTMDEQAHCFTAGNVDGKTTLTVKVNWRDIQSPFLTKEISIEIVNDFAVVMDGGAVDTIELYTFSLSGEITEFTNVNNRIIATYNGEACPFTVELVDNKAELDQTVEAVEMDVNYNIKCKNSGSAKLKVNVSTPAGIKPYYFDVRCKRPVKVIDSKIEYFETAIGVIHNFASYVPSGADGTIVSAYQDGRKLTVEDNKILDVSRKVVNTKSDEDVVILTKDVEYRFTLEAYTRVIEEGADLESLWWTQSVIDGGEAIQDSALRMKYWQANAIKGYYFVKNDIKDATPYVVKPYFDSLTQYSSLFSGTFDGNGKVIEYSIAENSKNGLFGDISVGAVIKNASFVVKAVKDSDTTDDVITTDNGVALARNIRAFSYYDKAKPVIRNVYVGYDVVFTPIGKNLSVGMSLVSIYARYENVVIDMSSVKGVKELLASDTGYQCNYSVFDNDYGSETPLDGSITQTNVFVISNVPYLKYKTAKATLDAIYVANNDSAVLENVSAKLEKTFGAYRFNDYDEAINYFKKDENKELLNAFGQYISISAGFPYVGNMNNLVNGAGVVNVNGAKSDEIVFDITDAGEDAKKTISLTYYGQAQEFTLNETLDMSDIVSVSGKDVIYNTGKADSAKLTITATINGEVYEREIFVKVSGINSLEGTVYYDGEGSTFAYLPASITDLEGYDINALTIISENSIPIIENGQAQLATNTTNTVGVYENAYVFLNGVVKGTITVNSVTKIITMASDLTSLYLTSADIQSEYNAISAAADKLSFLRNNAVKGYYFVANDIVYDENVKISPFYDGTYEYTSVFQGVFDGNGKTIEYDLLNTSAGLFGEIYGNNSESPIIKNAKFVIKDVSSGNNYMLARKIWSPAFGTKCWPLIQNVYVGYAKEFTPTTNNFQVGVCETGIYANYENVIVDMSKVQGVKDAIANDTEAKRSYSIFDSAYPKYGSAAIPAVGNFKNSIVISDVPYIKYMTSGGALQISVYAANEGIQANGNTYIYPNLSRFADYMALKQYFASNPELLEAFGFTDTSMGFPFVGDKQALINKETLVNDGETVVENLTFTAGQSDTKTINLSFLGDSYIPVITSNNQTVVTTEGNTVTYTGALGNATLTVSATIHGVEYQKVLTVVIKGLSELGTIYIDADGIYTADLSGEYAELNVIATDDTLLVADGVKQVSNDTNELVTYSNAYVLDGDTIKGIASVIVVKKVIDEASDLTSLYLTSAQIPAEYASATTDDARDNILRSVAVKGYYLVVNDIAYTPSVKIEPYYDAGSGKTTIFQGVFDGNGKTIEYDLLNSKVGLFGEIYGGAEQGAVIKNAKFLVKEVDVNVSRYMLASRIWASNNDYVHPIIENVYVGYDKAFTPVGTNLRVGISGTSHFVTYTNVIVDLSKVQGIKDSIENDDGATFTYNYGVFDRSYTDMFDGDFTNTIVISEVKNVKHAAVKDHGTGVTTYVNGYAANDNLQVEDEYVYASGLSRFDDYTALKQYLDTNTEANDKFANIIDAIEFPPLAE